MHLPISSLAPLSRPLSSHSALHTRTISPRLPAPLYHSLVTRSSVPLLGCPLQLSALSILSANAPPPHLSSLTPLGSSPLPDNHLIITMPKQIVDIRDFLQKARRKDAKLVKIRKRSDQTKFKIRCSTYLYTLVVQDNDKAEKLTQSLPPGLKRKDI